MKQGRDIEGDWKDDEDSPRRRWARRLRWAVGLAAVLVLGQITGITGDWLQMLALLILVVVGVLLARVWSARRGQRRWRRDSALVVPSLPNPVSRIPVEREWRWPSSPLVRVPLAAALIAALYWAIVLNELQLPAHLLFAVALLAFVNLWCWHEPLLLVAIVVPGVALLAVLGWLIEVFSIAGAVGVLLGLSVVVAITVAEFRKRFNRNHPWQ